MERELVVTAQSGDRGAFAALADASMDRLLRVAYGILGDAQLAEDATQQALLRMWRDLPRLRDPSRFEAWSYRLVVNSCRSEQRRTRGWPSILPLASIREPAMPDETNSVHDRDELEAAFRALSIDHRAVVILHHYLGHSIPMTAGILEIPEGTVRSRLHHAMRALRSAMGAPISTKAAGRTRQEAHR